ncbi:pyridoxal-dependent decarboxylase [Dactylosporangium darangshiense]|uniref:pyridoxal-dependent decarboxylase n=1 Tax=Dactylosporangium darangshiense TaxID=579108 RepID=UPI00362C0D44
MTAVNTTADPLALAALDKLAADLRYHATNNVGFPDATDLDVRPLLPLLGTLLNNVGAPFGPAGPYRGHSKRFELAVVQQTADLFRAPWDDRWGYITSGATEGTHCALWQARTRFPNAVVVASTAAHYGVARVADMLRMPLLTVPTDDRDEIDYAALTDRVRRYRLPRRRRVPVVVVASVGTTMTEAVDDVRKIHAALDTAGVPGDARWVHADAALAGVPLGLLDPDTRPGFDFADGATSIVVSGHKFLSVPMPCAVLVVLDSARPAGHDRLVSYTGSLDETVTGSRSGHAPLMLWWAWQVWGLDGLRQRATTARALAAATTARLDAIGWPAWRHPSPSPSCWTGHPARCWTNGRSAWTAPEHTWSACPARPRPCSTPSSPTCTTSSPAKPDPPQPMPSGCGQQFRVRTRTTSRVRRWRHTRGPSRAERCYPTRVRRSSHGAASDVTAVA